MKNSISILLIILLSACQTHQNFIIPADVSSLEKAFHPGKALTQLEANQIILDFEKDVKAKTIGKRIPKIIIRDIQEKQFELRDIIHRPTLLIITDTHCGWAMESVSEVMPKVIKDAENEIGKLNIMCILIKDSLSLKNPENYLSFLNEISNKYPHIYSIDEPEALKLNIFSSITRVVINEKFVVAAYHTGALPYERLLGEVKSYQD